jgi:hypothetical protein
MDIILRKLTCIVRLSLIMETQTMVIKHSILKLIGVIKIVLEWILECSSHTLQK